MSKQSYFCQNKKNQEKRAIILKMKSLEAKKEHTGVLDEDFSYIFSHTAAFIPDNFVRGTECFVFSKKMAQVFWDLKLSFALRQNWPWLEDFNLNSQD